MARWKVHVEFLLSVIELLFLSLTVEALQGKHVKTRCYQEGVGHFQPRFQGEAVAPGEYFFGFYKTRHIWLSGSANCTVLPAVVLTIPACDGRTDRQTDIQTELL